MHIQLATNNSVKGSFTPAEPSKKRSHRCVPLTLTAGNCELVAE